MLRVCALDFSVPESCEARPAVIKQTVLFWQTFLEVGFHGFHCAFTFALC